METDDAGFHVIRAARQQAYNPAAALLTASPASNGGWKHTGVQSQSLLVKPVGTEDLMRQIEALLVSHEDKKRSPRRAHYTADRQVPAWNREGGRKVS